MFCVGLLGLGVKLCECVKDGGLGVLDVDVEVGGSVP